MKNSEFCKTERDHPVLTSTKKKKLKKNVKKNVIIK